MFDRFSKALVDLFWSNPDALRKPSPTEGKLQHKAAPAPKPPVMTPQRAELIRNAMRIHRAKKKILADLSDEQREKLVAMAMQAFLAEAPSARPAKEPAVKAQKPPARKA